MGSDLAYIYEYIGFSNGKFVSNEKKKKEIKQKF